MANFELLGLIMLVATVSGSLVPSGRVGPSELVRRTLLLAVRRPLLVGIVVGSVLIFSFHVSSVRRLLRVRMQLIIAARDGDLATVQELLANSSRHSDDRSQDIYFLLSSEDEWQGVTALYAAALRGRTDVAALLLKAGAPPDQPNAMGDVPLAIAAQEGHAAIVSMLLRQGASADRQCPTTGATALLLACQNGHEACVRALLEEEALTDIANLDGNVRAPHVRPCARPCTSRAP